MTQSSCETLHFVPSNTMSLAHTITTMDAELALFTETWLSSTIPDELINIIGYQIFRHDHVGWQHSGVCLYVKSSIKCSILTDHYHPGHKVLWADLRPRCLPCGFSNIIVGVVYQYPDTDNAPMKEYLISTLMFLEATYPSCAFILAGNFNRTFLPMIQSAVKSFNLKPTVTFAMRGDRMLYQIFTYLGDYFSDPIRLPPFGLSDHATVYMSSSVCSASKPKHKIIKSRDKHPSKVNSVRCFLLEIV